MVTKSPFTCTPILNSRGIKWQPPFQKALGWSHHLSNSLSLFEVTEYNRPKHIEIRVWHKTWCVSQLSRQTFWIKALGWIISHGCQVIFLRLAHLKWNQEARWLCAALHFLYFNISKKCLENWKLLLWSNGLHLDMILMDNGIDLIILNTCCCRHNPTLTVSGLDRWPTIFKPRRSIAHRKQGILRILLGTSANHQGDQAIYVGYAVCCRVT